MRARTALRSRSRPCTCPASARVRRPSPRSPCGSAVGYRTASRSPRTATRRSSGSRTHASRPASRRPRAAADVRAPTDEVSMLLVHGGRVLRPDLECTSRRRRSSTAMRSPTSSRRARSRTRTCGASTPRDKLVIPGLVNGHNHAQTNLAKGLFDRYTLETATSTRCPGPPGGARRGPVPLVGDRRGEMVRKGCTAAYDMFAEFPQPTPAGVEAVAKALRRRRRARRDRADDGRPQLLRGDPRPRRRAARAAARPRRSRSSTRTTPQSLAACRQIFATGRTTARLRPSGARADDSASLHRTSSCTGCRDLARELDIGIQMHVGESKMQAVVGQRSATARRSSRTSIRSA